MALLTELINIARDKGNKCLETCHSRHVTIFKMEVVVTCRLLGLHFPGSKSHRRQWDFWVDMYRIVVLVLEIHLIFVSGPAWEMSSQFIRVL